MALGAAIVPGFAPIDADPMPAPEQPNTVAVASFAISNPHDGSGLQPGDVVTVAFRRGGDVDTCSSDLIVTGLQLVYR